MFSKLFFCLSRTCHININNNDKKYTPIFRNAYTSYKKLPISKTY